MRLVTVLVSRVFTIGISRNKEIHLKVLIEDDSKIFGPSSIGFLPPQLARLRPISGVSGKTLCTGIRPEVTHIGEEVFIDRNHDGSSKARSAQGASQAEFLREGIFRCRAGVGGQGSLAAMESP